MCRVLQNPLTQVNEEGQSERVSIRFDLIRLTTCSIPSICFTIKTSRQSLRHIFFFFFEMERQKQEIYEGNVNSEPLLIQEVKGSSYRYYQPLIIPFKLSTQLWSLASLSLYTMPQPWLENAEQTTVL